MHSLGKVTVDVRIQAVAIYVLIVFWHCILLGVHRSGENLPAMLQTLYCLLPLLTTLLALIVLESRIRHRQRCAWWVYFAVPFGLIPWIWYACFFWSA